MTAAEFLDLLRRSRLRDDGELVEFLNLPTSGEQLAANMVDAGLLTSWQAEKLLAGKFKGFQLGDYTILRHFRKSDVSQAYVAEHTRLKHKVVLKVLPSSRIDDPAHLDRFRKETGGGELHNDGAVFFVVSAFNGENGNA